MIIHKNMALAGKQGHGAYLSTVTSPLQGWDFDTDSYKATKLHATCLKEWKSRKFFTKVEQLLKIQLGQIPTVSVMSGNEREEKPYSLSLIPENYPNNSMHLALASARFRLFAVK